MKILKRLIKHFFLLRKLKLKNNKLSIFSKYDQLSTFKDFVTVQEFSSFRNTQINAYSSLGKRATIWNAEIGKFCSISWDVTIGAGSHHLDRLSTHAFPYIKKYNFSCEDNRVIKKTIIGNDVWIGANAIILDGLTIGNGAVIGAGSVVTKDIPDYAVVAGVPAKIIKFRFNSNTITTLNEIQWWNWERKKLKEHINLFKKPFTNDTLNKIKEIHINF